MKKIFIIFLVFVLTLCVFNVAIANEEIDLVGNIKQELDEIEGSIDRNEFDNAHSHFTQMREYVYKWAIELTNQNLYTDRLMDVISFTAKAIEEKDKKYIVEARSILEEILLNQPTLTIDKHS